MPVKLSLVESGKWNDPKYTVTLYKQIMEDDVLSKAIDHYAVHSYWSNEKDKKITQLYFSQLGKILPLHQSEWCEMKNGIDMGMDAALVLAKTIHEDMTILSVSSWEHWLAVSKYDYRDGLVYVRTESKKYGVPKRLWSFGNYSKFIKPGYKRIETEVKDSDVLVSAYVSPKKDETVIVAINSSKEIKTVPFNNIKGKKIEIYETSEKSNLSLVEEASSLENYEFPAESVTTFVIKSK